MTIVEALKNLMRRVPGRIWFAVGGCLLAAFWMQQHDARIRQQAGLQQVRNQASAEVATLRRQAAQDMRQANVENAEAIQKLEQRRQQAEQQNRQLAEQLARLRKLAQIQAGEVATLPISEIVSRVAAQLGLKAGDFAISSGKENARVATVNSPCELTVGSARGKKPTGGRAPTVATNSRPSDDGSARTADIAKGAASAPAGGGRQSRIHSKNGNVCATRDEEETPHPAAGASTLFPRRELGQTSSADIAKSAISAPPNDAAALALTSSGARKVEAALVTLDACRAESGIETRQVENCQARAEADEAEMKRLNGSVASLNQALAAKDKILARQQSEYKAEIRAARGTFLGRLARLTEHVAIGVAVGVAIGVAVK